MDDFEKLKNFQKLKMVKNKNHYEKNEIVFALYKYVLYKAKIIKEISSKEYKVHYLKWTSRWDEVLHISKIYPVTKCIKQIAKDLLIEARLFEKELLALQKNKEKTIEKSQKSEKIIKKSKNIEKLRKIDEIDENKNPHPESNNNISNVFKSFKSYKNMEEVSKIFGEEYYKKVSEDYKKINFEKKLTKLQHQTNFNIDAIIKRSKLEDKKHLSVFTDKIIRILNNSFKTNLIYPEEKEQLNDVLKRGLSPSAVYGAVHFLRFLGVLYLNLPTDIELLKKNQVINNLTELLKFVMDLMKSDKGLETEYV